MTHEEEMKMFGATIADLVKSKPEMISDLDYAISILSDAQECISMESGERARQYINRAKYFIRRDKAAKKEQATKSITDRDRNVDYNGKELYMNTYHCSSCNQTYVMQVMLQEACPLCGTKYTSTEDVSI